MLYFAVMRRYACAFLLLLPVTRALSQFPGIYDPMVPRDTAIKNYSTYKRSFTIAGLLQTRYSYSLTKHVDVNGAHFDSGGITNTFSLKRVRIQAKAQVNDHFDAVILINLADFSSSNLSGKVLENAYIRYTLSRHFHVIGGQYRPFFGIEDAIPVDLIKSLDYSNMYYAFGNSGWQSFQVGACVYGDITGDNQLPLRYYVGVHNGNGKNQVMDNDNSKHVYGRLEADLSKQVTIGINAGNGSIQNQHGSAWGGDIKALVPLAKKWKFEFTGDYKEGSNFADFAAYTGAEPKTVGDFKMRGFYAFPTIRYEYTHPRVRSIEFSSRYEYLNTSTQFNSNPRQTIIPMLSMEFADNYFATLQVGVIIDLFKHDVPLTTSYTHNLAVAQLQIRF